MAEPTGIRETPDARSDPRTKRPYTAPAITWNEAWDAHANLMAACGRKDVMQPGCDTEPAS
jgi:hypothetical protein